LFYDDGIGGNNTGWTKNNCTANYDDTGTEFIPTANWGNLTIPNSDYYSSMPFVIEFEIVEITGNIRFYYDDSNHYSEVSATGQYRMEVTSSGVTLKKDGTTVRTSDAPVTLTNIAIVSNTTSNKCKFKEFKIYPI